MSKKNTRILIVDDEEIVRESLSGWLEKDGYTIGTAPDGLEGARGRWRRRAWSILLVDLKMPGIDGLEVLKRVKDEEPRDGRRDHDGLRDGRHRRERDEARRVRLPREAVRPRGGQPHGREDRRAAGPREGERDPAEGAQARVPLPRPRHEEPGAPCRATLELAQTAARSPSTILVLGESGTGKELLARAIHAESPRHGKPFVAMSCAALTETLLESELFGYEKGAFTGASGRREGKFEAANGGTLFLDEIGDISPKLQLDLLRVLEERRVTRVGGTESIPVDVRIIAATNRDLQKAVAEGRFRQDLFYRLNVITLTLVAAARAQGGHPAPRRPPPRAARRRAEEAGRGRLARGDGAPPRPRLAGQRARAAQRPRARDRRLRAGRSSRPADLGLTLRGGGGRPAHPASLEEIERQHIAACPQADRPAT